VAGAVAVDGKTLRGTVASGPKVRWLVATWSRFPSRRLPDVLKEIIFGIADGVQGLWSRTPG